MHVAHDGLPPQLKALTKRPELALLVELLFATLRRDPAERPTATVVKNKLKRLGGALASLPWPIDAR
jgi:hypothetical protein